MSPTYDDVERAIGDLAGVASASIGAVEGTERGRLRIRLEPGHDADEVAVAVAAMLDRRFGIDVDPAAIRPRPADDDDVARPVADDRSTDASAPADEAPGSAPATEMPANGDAPAGFEATIVSFARPVIRALSVTTEGLEARADVHLAADGREVHAHSVAAATQRARLRAIVRAGLLAVEQLSPGRVKGELESLEVGSDGDDQVVTVTVTLLTAEGTDKLIGVSIVRDDVEQAVLRATLDAVNRRVGLLIQEPVG